MPITRKYDFPYPIAPVANYEEQRCSMVIRNWKSEYWLYCVGGDEVSLVPIRKVTDEELKEIDEINRNNGRDSFL